MATDDIPAIMNAIGAAAKDAAAVLAAAPSAQKTNALAAMADALSRNADAILAANAEDVTAAEAKGLTGAMLDRLTLTPGRIGAMADGVATVAAGPDPVGETIAAWERPSGLKIRRVRTPLGVIGVIYESRPNVTADAGALCLKSGNAAILRGGSESALSSAAIHAALVEGLCAADLPAAAIQRVPTTDRAAVGHMLAEMAPFIDVIVPRGGKGLVGRVQAEARVPVFAHLEGICHLYLDASADLDKARAIAVNAKMRRTGTCGAAECLLIDRAAADRVLAPVIKDLLDAGCAVRGDADVQAADPRVAAASEADFGHEFLDSVIAAKLVDGVGGAVEHIRRHGSGHTEAIIAEDDAAAAQFFNQLDSAILMRNASTQFADGGEFGMGAEIGIATGKMHARGPVGAEQLTSFKYLVEADCAIRP